MRAAIYTVSKGGKEIARLPALIWVRLAEPGLYLVCGEDEGEGVTFEGTKYTCIAKKTKFSPAEKPKDWKEVK